MEHLVSWLTIMNKQRRAAAVILSAIATAVVTAPGLTVCTFPGASQRQRQKKNTKDLQATEVGQGT